MQTKTSRILVNEITDTIMIGAKKIKRTVDEYILSGGLHEVQTHYKYRKKGLWSLFELKIGKPDAKPQQAVRVFTRPDGSGTIIGSANGRKKMRVDFKGIIPKKVAENTDPNETTLFSLTTKDKKGAQRETYYDMTKVTMYNAHGVPRI